MADDHKTVLLSILATMAAAVAMFAVTFVIADGISIDLIKAYVVPLVVSSFTLTVFWGVVFARNKGKLPWFETAEPPKAEKVAETPKSTE